MSDFSNEVIPYDLQELKARSKKEEGNFFEDETLKIFEATPIAFYSLDKPVRNEEVGTALIGYYAEMRNDVYHGTIGTVRPVYFCKFSDGVKLSFGPTVGSLGSIKTRERAIKVAEGLREKSKIQSSTAINCSEVK